MTTEGQYVGFFTGLCSLSDAALTLNQIIIEFKWSQVYFDFLPSLIDGDIFQNICQMKQTREGR